MLSQTFTWTVWKLVDHFTKKVTLRPKFQQHTPQKKSLTHGLFYENSLILAVHDQKLKYWIYLMQIPASARGLASKYRYQLDSLKLSRDRKQHFNRDKGTITIK